MQLRMYLQLGRVPQLRSKPSIQTPKFPIWMQSPDYCYYYWQLGAGVHLAEEEIIHVNQIKQTKK